MGVYTGVGDCYRNYFLYNIRKENKNNARVSIIIILFESNRMSKKNIMEFGLVDKCFLLHTKNCQKMTDQLMEQYITLFGKM